MIYTPASFSATRPCDVTAWRGRVFLGRSTQGRHDITLRLSLSAPRDPCTVEKGVALLHASLPVRRQTRAHASPQLVGRVATYRTSPQLTGQIVYLAIRLERVTGRSTHAAPHHRTFSRRREWKVQVFADSRRFDDRVGAGCIRLWSRGSTSSPEMHRPPPSCIRWQPSAPCLRLSEA